jgi:lipopolysaccharide/colanic/teichoic acid biosynthesis glycosyltransferase
MLRIDTRLHSPTSRARLLSRFSAFDVFWASLSPALAYILRHGWFEWIDRLDAMAIYSGVAFLTSILTFQLFKISKPMSRYFSAGDAIEVAKACVISVSIAGAFLFTFTRMEETPRSVPLLHFFILAGGLIAGRSLARIRRGLRDARKPDAMSGPVENIIIIGVSRLAWFYTKLVEEFCAVDSQVVALLDERPQFHRRSVNGHLIAGSPLHIFKIFDEYALHGIEINKIAIAVRIEEISGDAWIEITRIAKERSIELDILPERLFLSSPARRSASQVAQVRQELAEGTNRPIWKLKRVLDVLLSAVVMIAIAPIAAMVAILVLIDVGNPVMFWQQRVGSLGRSLHIYKFRTMKAPFDKHGHPIPEDQRLSWIGRFLRASRLDEIPQLWNIFTGSMAVVGPRPLLPVDQPKNFGMRLQVSPGLTGLAQICGGKNITVEEKDALDELYVKHNSLLLELKIMLLTAWVMVCGDRRNELLIAAALAEKRGYGERKPVTPHLTAPAVASEARAGQFFRKDGVLAPGRSALATPPAPFARKVPART